MKRLNKVMRAAGIVLMGACVGSGLVSFMKGNMNTACLMAVLSMMNLMAFVLLVIIDQED